MIVMTVYLFWGGSRMWTRLQSLVGDVVGRINQPTHGWDGRQHKPQKYVYQRPDFLNLNEKEFKEAKDRAIRNVVKTKQTDDIPRQAGYAE